MTYSNITSKKQIGKIYLDYAATTPVDPEVTEEMLPYFTEMFGNPSSLYSFGQEARQAIEKSRTKVSALIGAQSEEIIFTGSGTEADNFAIKGVAYANKGKGNHIITTAIEHHAVIETCRFLEDMGFRITYLPVDQHGMVDPDEVKKNITDSTILISIMHANNEIGTIQPIDAIGQIAREAGVYFHVDAVQTSGHIPVNVDDFSVDLLSMSAHKMYGPKGIGALYVRKGTKLVPFIHGGQQEVGRRAGTENVPGIVGFGKAAELARNEMDHEAERLIKLRDRLIEGITGTIDNTRLLGHPTRRLPNHVSINVSFIKGVSLLQELDLEGICASTGSACSSGSKKTSHVLQAIGLGPEESPTSLRLTLGKWTTYEEIERIIEILPPMVERLRFISSFLKKSGIR